MRCGPVSAEVPPGIVLPRDLPRLDAKTISMLRNVAADCRKPALYRTQRQGFSDAG